MKQTLPPDLIAQNALYRAVTEITNDCLWNWDIPDQSILWIDGGHSRQFGYEVHNDVVREDFWFGLIHEEDRPEFLAHLEAVFEAKEKSSWRHSYRLRKADGSFAHVEDKGEIKRNEDGVAIRMIGSTRNVTEMVELEKKLEHGRVMAQLEKTQAVVEAQERERSQIGEELHDNINQILAVTKMYIQMGLSAGPDGEMYLRKSMDQIVLVMNEIRRIAKSILIPNTNILSLKDNIENLIEDIAQVHSLKIQLALHGFSDGEVSPKLQLTIFRIIQEQTTNILKHADASEAGITITKQDNTFSVTISDNGNGWDTHQKPFGVGLLNIRNRADLYDGRVRIHSSKGKGFELKVWLRDEPVL
ncbi:MAG: hypothetical protein EOO09_12115 [Chitinophagaceae bacterium]|nr:MAG: hypothetical protein EOO09_12115 [Chitinophagaceae bacterium]